MKNRNPYTTIVILLAVVAMVVFVAIYFLFEDIKTRSEHASKLSSDISNQSTTRNYLISTQRIVGESNPDIAKINDSIIPVDGDVAFIESLESFSRENGVQMSIDALRLDDGGDRKQPTVVFKIRAKTSGSWSNTYKLISEIELLPIKVKIDALTLSGTKELVSGGQKKSTDSGYVWQGVIDMSVLKYK